MKAILIYQTNYNGWIGTGTDELTDDLADFSCDFCDEYGEFEYHEFPTSAQDRIFDIVLQHNPYVTEVEIQYDRFST